MDNIIKYVYTKNNKPLQLSYQINLILNSIFIVMNHFYKL